MVGKCLDFFDLVSCQKLEAIVKKNITTSVKSKSHAESFFEEHMIQTDLQ